MLLCFKNKIIRIVYNFFVDKKDCSIQCQLKQCIILFFYDKSLSYIKIWWDESKRFDSSSEVKWRNSEVNKIPEIAVEFCPQD